MSSKTILRIGWALTIFNLIVTPINLIAGNYYVAIFEGLAGALLVVTMIGVKKASG